MKIVMISPDSGGGGIYRFYNDLLLGLSPLADCQLLVRDPFNLAPDARPPAPVGISQPDEDRAAGLLLRALPQVLRMVTIAQDAWNDAQRLEPDIIEVCDWPLGFVPAILAQDHPYVVQCHGSAGQIAQHDPQKGMELEEAAAQLIEPQLFASAHRMVTYSDLNAQFWSGMINRPVRMIYPAYSLPPEVEPSPSISDAGAVFGRLQRWKGPHILCGALRSLGHKAPRVDWYGNAKPWHSQSWPTDRRLATDYPDVWGSHFRHHPAVSRDTVARIQASALFNVVPSTWDMFNFTAVESMGSARPTIVSSGAGAAELIVDGENGFLFENENPESLATAIDRVLSMTDARRAEIGRAGRETIRIRLDPAFIAGQRMEAYSEAISAFGTAPPPKPNPWISDLLCPSYGARADPGLLLELVPLRAAVGHVKDRILQKLGWTRQFK